MVGDYNTLQDIEKAARENIIDLGALATKMRDYWQERNRPGRRKEVNIKITNRECELILISVAISMDRVAGKKGSEGVLATLGATNLGLLGNRELDLD